PALPTNPSNSSLSHIYQADFSLSSITKANIAQRYIEFFHWRLTYATILPAVPDKH
ncbi:4303_t:CDS:1, partial [Paraglomus brasilianum]